MKESGAGSGTRRNRPPGVRRGPVSHSLRVGLHFWLTAGDCRGEQAVEAVPVLQVSPWSTACIAPPNSMRASGLAITVQIPFDAAG